MKNAMLVIAAVAIALVVMAQEKPEHPPVVAPDRASCTLVYTAHDWDFTVSDQGFTTAPCDPNGLTSIWAWGLEGNVVGSPGNVWGTVLNGNYDHNAGESLLSPPFLVTDITDKMEIRHYVQIETNYDGGNVSVNGTVIPPMDGYPATISTSTFYHAYCVDNEEGFTGNSSSASENWVERCFDLSAYNGQTIQVSFDFGSDSGSFYPGWYLEYVKIGDDQIPVELQGVSVE